MSEYTIEQMHKDAEDLAYEIVQEAILTRIKKDMRRRTDDGFKNVIVSASAFAFETHFGNMRALRKHLGGKKSKWLNGCILYVKQMPKKFETYD